MGVASAEQGGENIAQFQDDFAHAFESAFARLQVRIEEACAAETEWPQAAAAAIQEALAFAAANPGAAQLLTNEALAGGAAGFARYERMIAYLAGLLVPGREQHPDGARLPQTTERAVVSGIVMVVAGRLDQGQTAELGALAPEAIEFVLMPYLGVEEARRVASKGR